MKRSWQWLGVIGLAVAVVGCGGGAVGESPDAAPDTPAFSLDTLDAAGGQVVGSGGVTVVVPEGALAAPVTLRIAADAAGAPPLPASMRPAGEVWAVTPGGLPLAQAVELRIPRPNAAIPEDEELALVQVDAQRQWQAVGALDRATGELVAQVQRLGHFAVVAVPRPLKAALATTLPIAYSMSMTCSNGSCLDLPVVPTEIRVTVKSNGGVFPASCVNPTLRVLPPGVVRGVDVALPLFGGTVTRTLTRPSTSTLRNFSEATVRCANGSVIFSELRQFLWQNSPDYPGLAVDWSPPALQATPGEKLTISALFRGGAAKLVGFEEFRSPTPEDRALITWERSDDDGLSWRAIGTSYQDESPDPKPSAAVKKWFVWKMSTRLAVTAADANALFRARACYTPPGVAAPPCVATKPARLTLINAPTLPEIKSPPKPLRIVAGQTASFSVGVSGLPVPTLQWQQRPANSTATWTNIAGATAASYTTGVLGLPNNGQQYRLVATNAVGSTPSLPVTVSVDARAVAPTIVNAPLPITVLTGSDAVFAVRAAGTDALSFQWRRNGVNLTGANSAVLRLPAVDATKAGDYSVVVTNAVGSVASAAGRLTVSAIPVSVVPPTIVAGPASASVAQGQSVTFTVGVTGTGPFTYQWLKGGIPIDGATAAGYTIASAQPGDADSYSVIVTSGAIGVTSPAAALDITAVAPPSAPTITTQPVSVVVVPGATTTLAVAASGTGPLAYQWFQDGSPITPGNGPTLTLDSIASISNGSYTVTVGNALGSVTSEPAEVLVAGAPQVGTVADVYEVSEGSVGEFTISAIGSGLRYQWTRNGVAIPGATEANYTTPVLALADSGAVYGVIVYNGAGLVIVPGTLLTVTPAGPPPGMVLFAGDFSSAGTAIGTGTAARFDSPQGLTADASGNLYVASSNGKFVSKIDPGAAVTHLFFASITATSFFANPALAPDGSLFVGSNSWCGLWRAEPPLTAPAPVTEITLANCPVYSSNGLSVDPLGRVAIADTSRHAIILATQQPGGAWTQSYFAGGTNYFDGDANRGSTDATGTAARFSGPTGLAYAANGDLFVADHDNGTIRRITPAGEVSTFAGAAGQQSTLDGTGTAARFDRPYGLTFDPDGNLIVLQLGASTAAPAWVRRVTMGGVVTTLFDARAEAAALASDGNAVANARSVKGIAAPGSKRIAISAGNAVLVRTLP